MENIIIIAVLIIITVIAGLYIYRSKKKRVKCIGCSVSCSKCMGTCNKDK